MGLVYPIFSFILYPNVNYIEYYSTNMIYGFIRRIKEIFVFWLFLQSFLQSLINRIIKQKILIFDLARLFLICVGFFLFFNQKKEDISFFRDLDYHNRRDKMIISHLNHKYSKIFTVLGCENELIDQGRSYENENIEISQCFFSRYLMYSSDNGYGGVIYVDADSFFMKVNNTMFYNCCCSSEGGAIFFKSSNLYLRMICANRCSASSFHFACLVASQINQIEFLSMSDCSHSASGWYSILLGTGYQRDENANSSMNNAFLASGIFINSPSSFTSSHCTFSNNHVSHSVCIIFYSDAGIMIISYSNIVHNNSPLYGVVSVDRGGSPLMKNSIFQNNTNFLFYVNAGSLGISHSFIDHSPSSFSSATPVSTEANNSFLFIVTHQIQFFNSHYCYTDSPEEILDQTPMRSYDSECELKMLSKHRIMRKSDKNMFPVFISFVMT